MTKVTRVFEIAVTFDIDDAVYAVVDDEWRSVFYDLNTKDEIADHIAFNLLRGRTLSQLDGWANMPDSMARLIDIDYN